MYYMSKGFAERGIPGGKILAVVFSIFCILGALGGGNMFLANQAHAQISGIFGDFPGWITGLVFAAVVFAVIVGGINFILDGNSIKTVGGVSGVSLTSAAFATGFSWFPYVLAIPVVLFAFSTMISWSYYGLKAWTYLFGESKTAELVSYAIFHAACSHRF